MRGIFQFTGCANEARDRTGEAGIHGHCADLALIVKRCMNFNRESKAFAVDLCL